MKKHTVKLKGTDMQCSRCLMNVVKALSQLNGILELNADLERKSIMVKFNNNSISREIIQEIVDDSIINGKRKMIC